jgi:pimeloyl-ACP methyl ester carboxylesterase
MIEISPGHALHAVFEGPSDAAAPLVVLEAGSFGFSADWAAVQAKLTRLGLRSMAYDRAGLGFSGPGAEPRDGLAIAADLAALLAAAGEAGPLILCAHSMAGLHARLFTALHPGRVGGVVLVDATTPEAMDSKAVSGFVGQFARASRLAAWGAEAGLLRPLSGTGLGDFIGLEGAAGAEKRWAFAHAAHNHWAAREVESWPETAREAREAGTFDRRLPVAVVLAGAPGPLTGIRAVQSAPALASDHGLVEFTAGANHATMLSGGYADAIVRAVVHVKLAFEALA